MSLDSRIRWLRIASVVTVGFGFLLAMAAIPAMGGPAQFLLDLIYFPIDGAQAVDSSAARLLNAITGGLMTGLGVITFLIAGELLPREPALARRILLAGIGAWFLVDSSMSIAAGAPLNAVFNFGFLLLFYLPLWKPVDASRESGTV
jgi:multisubunit Na+/H+ antiporter MnhB subunit